MTRAIPRGFTLLEMVIAMSLGSVVLMAAFGIMSSMFRFQIEGIRKSAVTSASMASVMKMNKEIESANVLVAPGVPGVGSDFIGGCSNWSHVTGARLDANSPVTVFYYCHDVANSWVRRLAEVSNTAVCPALGVLPACNAVAYTGLNQTNDILALDVHRFEPGQEAGDPHISGIFQADYNSGGVRIFMNVGQRTPVSVAGQPDIVNPQFITINTTISMSNSYPNAADTGTFQP